MAKPGAMYTEDVKAALEADLDELASKPKGVSLKELVQDLALKIEIARNAGYTLSDVVEVFKGRKIDVSENTLKQYLRDRSKSGVAKDKATALVKTPIAVKTEKSVDTQPDTPQVTNGDQSPKPPHSVPDTATTLSPEIREYELINQVTGTDERGFVKPIPDDEL